MKIGVVGLGLIGGSIFKALRGKTEYDLIGVSSSVKEENVSNNYETLKDCDLVFVCTPMNVTLEILDKLDGLLPASAIVTDVCSLKGFVSKKTYSYKFIPSHPMAGTENSFLNIPVLLPLSDTVITAVMSSGKSFKLINFCFRKNL